MFDNKNWFTEHCSEAGSAFSLQIKEKLHEEQTPFQKIEIFETRHFGRLLVIDGFIMLSDRDNFIYHEMMAHPVLFTHAKPAHVCIIGGGDCGTLKEVLKHPEVLQVTQIDIDERVTRVSETFFPDLCESNHDPRARLLFEDGIKWMRNTAPGSLDIIIVDSTDPIGPGEVLFTSEFYRACRVALATGGILIQQSESPIMHMDIISDMHKRMQVAEFSEIQTLFFPLCVYPSGWWSATMACKDRAFKPFRRQALEHRGFRTRYYNADIHQAALAAPEFFRAELASSLQAITQERP